MLKQWEAWYGELGPALVDAGNPFTPMAKRIGSDGMVKAEPRETMASGYTIINADSLDAAARMAKGCPILQSGGAVTVYETFAIEAS